MIVLAFAITQSYERCETAVFDNVVGHLKTDTHTLDRSIANNYTLLYIYVAQDNHETAGIVSHLGNYSH